MKIRNSRESCHAASFTLGACLTCCSLPTQLILVGTGAATIWIMPFMDYWDNVVSITSMGGMPLWTHSSHYCWGQGLHTLAHLMKTLFARPGQLCLLSR